MKSVTKGQHSFARVPSVDIPRSSFDRSHGHKTTFDAGKLIPIYCDEVLPGDTFNMNATVFARLNTPITPIMDNMYLDVHFFFVPYRLIWDNFRKFMGEQVDPGDSIDFTIPVMDFTGNISSGSIHDYLGLPIGGQPSNVSALPRRAYNFIYNEWYRDQNMVNSLSISTGDGPDTQNGNGGIWNRGKRHDYFTSCLPWPQKGDAVTLPLGESAPVQWVDPPSSGIGFQVREPDGTLITNMGTGFVTDGVGLLETSEGTARQVTFDPNGFLEADLTSATAATINQLRQAFAIQRLQEQDARGGTRYSELVKSHFGVDFYDVSYRPEFLGGGSTSININPVAQTTSTDTTTPQGNLAAFGTAGAGGIGFSKSFVEHGLVMGIASVRADLTYQQGIPRYFSRQTRYDFYWPTLAHIGEQAVLNKEIYFQGTTADDEVFGYQERYAEYRYHPSRISGLMRSDASSSLDIWHLSQDFGSLPTLNSTFISEDPPIHRVVALPDEPDFLFDSYFSLRCARPMPLFGVPGMGGRF